MTTTNITQPVAESAGNANIKLKDIIGTIPREYFQKNRRKAWSQVALTLTAVALGYLGIFYAPWYLLPIAWLFTGTALTGLFVIGHDCAHRSFAKKIWVNDLVGHIMMLPLIYPFHGWRVQHDRHHVHTNKLEVDNAWEPWTVDSYSAGNGALQFFYRAIRKYFWWIGSIAHWAVNHFNPSMVPKREQDKIKLSATVVLLFSAVFFPTMIATVGIWGLVKFWVVPWLIYHFWMSTFTLVHHTAKNIQFEPAETWNEAIAQLSGTVHCVYPKWVELLCHDINVHVPHHISVAIPSYNLRLVHQSLRENWGEYLQEQTFSWALMNDIISQCHLYHPEEAYQTFKEIKPLV
ncbi:Delta-12 acyl-phospholipid desaturase [Thalassoporum mexicanum PCC 7367]|uniref:fatty acid desaturase n=1 Tax=Thalassoporum mexicanum TaxID=3457544 RepID=UPI00029F8C82|nr:fatty acid desaturase [Pseudanabaena sp. PCC 7367]AFY71116.1 Delta-12 acyl-phospholipid desaturase [Pseudanabaena sp. PCC 7367]